MFNTKEAKKSFLRVFENKREIYKSQMYKNSYVLDYMKDKDNQTKDCCIITLDDKKMKWKFYNHFYKAEIKFDKMEYEQFVMKMYEQFPELKEFYRYIQMVKG